MIIHRHALSLVVLVVSIGASTHAGPSSGELAAKQVAAPAFDIVSGLVVLPTPGECATRSSAAILPIEFEWENGVGWKCDRFVPVETTGALVLACLAPGAEAWNVALRTHGGAFVPIERALAGSGLERREERFVEGLPGWTVARFDVANAPAGAWDVRITLPRDSARARPSSGQLIVRGTSAVAISAHVTSLMTLSDREIVIAAHLYAGPEDRDSNILRDVVQAATVFLDSDGGSREIAMWDDGAHDDGLAGDGVFGARLPRGVTGNVSARVELRGLLAQSAAVVRSVILSFPVLDRRTMLSGNVDARVEDETRLRIDIGALPLGPATKLHVSAEVWGTSSSGELVPVCWLSRMQDPLENAGEWKLPLFLDARWLDLARATPPLALHNVRIQDPATEVPFDLVEWMSLPVTVLPIIAPGSTSGVSTHMLMGPPDHSRINAGLASGIPTHVIAPALMLVHGWCSGGSIWPAADFTQPKLEFLDPNANRTHDEFAQLMLQAGSALSSFGVVAHSQGGMAALHLYTYYTSGLDFAAGNRRIQSLCTPYQGTPLASLGGFSCGVNNDLTTSGAATWLAGIPSWARAEVWFWTVTDGGSACNSLTNLLLTGADDGVIQQAKGQLPGAHSMGNVTGWCHSTGMTYPAAYTDHARNAQMNAQAAR